MSVSSSLWWTPELEPEDHGSSGARRQSYRSNSRYGNNTSNDEHHHQARVGTANRDRPDRVSRRELPRPQRQKPGMKTFLHLDTTTSASSFHSRSQSFSLPPPPTAMAHDLSFRGRPYDHRQPRQLDREQDLSTSSFFFSRRQSTATTTTTADTINAANISTAAASTDATAPRNLDAATTTLHHSALRELRDAAPLAEHEYETDLPDRGRQRYQTTSHHLRVFDHFPIDERPSSSRSHLRYWHRSKSPVHDASKYLRVSSDGSSSPSINNLPSMTMTREEFDALPPTIQRKYFSNIERLHFTLSPPDPATDIVQAPDSSTDAILPSPPAVPLEDTSRDPVSVLVDSSQESPHRRTASNERQFYANLPDKIKRLHLSKEEQLAVQTRRRSLSVGAVDFVKKPKNRQSLRALGGTTFSLGSTVSLIDELSTMTTFESSRFEAVGKPEHPRESFMDSFRWLEEEEELDLRLFLDDYHINLREEVPLPSKSRRPSFRRHLSVSKLPFGRTTPTPRVSTSSRGYVSPTTGTTPTSANSDGPGHFRRKSRTLSLLGGDKQHTASASVVDLAATHYQDPEARLKLREYLVSPQKFDEALEYGFPSMEDRSPDAAAQTPRVDLTVDIDKSRTFFNDAEDDDEKIFGCSDDGSVADPESPRTPHAFDKPPSERSRHSPASSTVGTLPLQGPKTDFLQAPSASREMTLRMTLTRPDLRANEEQMYGWRKDSPPAQVAHARALAKAPAGLAKEGSSKENIERQLAAFDQEDMALQDNGGFKRFWKRVRRA